jgi:outer membrane protein TolC
MRGLNLWLVRLCTLTAAVFWDADAEARQTPATLPNANPPSSVTAPRADRGQADPAGTPPFTGDGRTGTDVITPPVPLTSNLDPNFRPIDLNTALRLGGVQNPDLMIARQRVVEAVALKQLAAAQILPSLNGGVNYDSHNGVLQQSNGNILSVNRSAIYVGAGANAIAAGTVNIPGVVLTGNIAQGVYGFLVARQFVRERESDTLAIRNQAFLQIGLAYSELLRAEGRRAVAMQIRDEGAVVYRLVAAYAKVGQNKQSDAERAATELARRQADVQRADGDVLIASARLCEVLNLDPSIRLHPTDAWVTPQPIVPDPMPVPQLIALALLRRPELAARRAAIRGALLALDGAKVLPFSPTILVGFSAGGFGGGSNLVNPVFGSMSGRNDFDAVTYWTLQNLGVGNAVLIKSAKAQLGLARLEEIAVMDRVRAEVAEANAKTHARFALIQTYEQAVRSSTKGFREDLTRARGAVGLPLEVLDSLRLLATARYDYLDSIVDYNRAQFELYVAMGQPPAAALARPVPTGGVVAAGEPVPSPPGEAAVAPPPLAPRGAANTSPPASPPLAVNGPLSAPRSRGR